MSATDTPTAVGDAPTLAARRLDGLADRAARARPADDGDGPSGDPDAIDVFAPATDERIGSVPACGADDVAAAVERARAAQEAWAETPAAERARIVERFGELVADRREALLDVLQVETGKSRRTAVEELFDVPTGCSYVASEAPDALAEERRRGVAPGITTATVTREPVGVVGVI
ncbi:succinic semialdehyde dehydrogenase, partial [Halorubrum distributum]